MEMNWDVVFYSSIGILWLWTISDKLSDIIKLLEAIAKPKIKEDISKLADDLFTAEYNKMREEAVRRMK